MKMAKDMFEAFKIVKMNVKIDKRLTEWPLCSA